HPFRLAIGHEQSAVNSPCHFGTNPAPVHPDPLRPQNLRVSALSFSSSSSSFSRFYRPLCAHAGTPTTPVPSAIYFITRGHPRVGGIHPLRSSSVNPAHSALKPTRSFSAADPLSAKAPTATLMPLYATLTKKPGGQSPAAGRSILPKIAALPPRRLSPPPPLPISCELSTVSLILATSRPKLPTSPSVSLLYATLTQNQGGGSLAAHSAARGVILPRMTASRLRLFNLELLNARQQPQAVSGRLPTTRTGHGARATCHGARGTDHEFKMIRWLTAVDRRGAACCAPSRQPSEQMATHVPILIIGAGISGLACAYHLRKSGIDARIVEAGPRPGGVIRSERRDGFLLEIGPQSFSGTPPLRDLCRDLGIENELLEAPHSAPRFLLIKGLLEPAPLNPPSFFASSLFSLSTKWSILRDAIARSTPPYVDESVAAFTRRKFSAELLDKLVGPFVSGNDTGDPEKLSLRA